MTTMTAPTPTNIVRGNLWRQLLETTDSALASGSLHRIETRQQIISDCGIPFSVHIATNLQRKAKEKARRKSVTPEFDPFLPPEPPLTVGALGEGHIAVLNKYNVVEHHLLIVTRHFEHQESLLTQADLNALCWCLREYDGLGFYNGGTVAGASQRHKHLQLIPTPLTSERHCFPVEEVFTQALDESSHYLAALPFPHRIAGLPSGLFEAPQQAASHCLGLYREMLAQLGHIALEHSGREYQSAPYNLLLTRRWLMIVPRTHEHFGATSINAMGFAGSLFVLDEKGLEEIWRAGPVAVLQTVST